MKKIVFLIIFSLVMYSFTFAQTQIELDKIKEIKLLESNRDDVRRILGSYKLEAKEEYYYDWFSTNDAKIRVDYSEGDCEEILIDGFKVPEWKAIYIAIEPDNPIKLKDLEINLSKYKKEKRYHDIDDLYLYFDKESGIIFTVEKGEITAIEFIPSPKYYNLMCDQEKAKKLSVTSSIFEDKLKDRTGHIRESPPASVEKLNLSRTTITASCNLPDSNKIKNCSDTAKTINISTIAKDPDGDYLTYNYTVSGGKIIGTGAKVVWDLTGVAAGSYKITAAVDDGCGYCGYNMTKTIVVKECNKCHPK